jgi:hypothetical protein
MVVYRSCWLKSQVEVIYFLLELLSPLLNLETETTCLLDYRSLIIEPLVLSEEADLTPWTAC